VNYYLGFERRAKNAKYKKRYNFDCAVSSARFLSSSIYGLRIDRYGFAAFGRKMRLGLQEFKAGLELYFSSRSHQPV